jgi:hypothetical protein
MTKIRVLQQMSGSRYDGQAWPETNGKLNVPEWEAADLVAAGLAERVDEPEPEREQPAGDAPPVLAADADFATTVDEIPSETRPPAINAPKADWVDHAIAQGHDPDEAENMTKASLIETYGA